MKTNKKDRHQFTILIIGLIIAFIIIIITAFFIAKAIKNDKFTGDENPQNASVPEYSQIESSQQDSSVTDSSSEEDSSVIDTNTGKPAVDYVKYTTQQLIAEWDKVYKNEGYNDGGLAIRNERLCPYFFFIVPDDGNANVKDGAVQSIVVTEGGMVTSDIKVGMTYAEIKEKIGVKIQPADSNSEKESSQALITGDNYTATIIFNGAGQKSIRAIVKAK